MEDWVQRQIKASDMWTDVLCQAEMSHVARFGGFPFDTIRKAIHGQDSRIIGNITLQLDENRKPRAIRDISTPEPSKYAPGEMVSTQAIWRSGEQQVSQVYLYNAILILNLFKDITWIQHIQALGSPLLHYIAC